MGFTAGAVGILVNGGSVGSALRNGMIGGVFGAVGTGFTYAIGSGIGSFAGRALAHGALNSFMTRARGGRWNSGFWAGFAGTMLSPVVNSARGYYAKIAANAMVAGTVSQITGGKFANGAWSGAFRFMFNETMHPQNFVQNVKKEFSDFFEGVLSVPKALYAYGDYLARISGFRDWQNDNILPWNRWEAEIEYMGFNYAIINYPDKIANALWVDIQNRPNYYLGGMILGPIGGQISTTIGRSIGAISVIKIPGAISDTIHTKINPLHRLGN